MICDVPLGRGNRSVPQERKTLDWKKVGRLVGALIPVRDTDLNDFRVINFDCDREVSYSEAFGEDWPDYLPPRQELLMGKHHFRQRDQPNWPHRN